MSTDFQAALDRAKAKASEITIPISRTLFGEEFTFHFLTAFPATGAELIDRFQQWTKGGDHDVDEIMKAVVEYLDLMATEESQRHIEALVRERIISIPELMQMAVEVTERVTGRPFTSGPLLPPPSPSTGDGSTAGVRPEEQIPPILVPSDS